MACVPLPLRARCRFERGGRPAGGRRRCLLLAGAAPGSTHLGDEVAAVGQHLQARAPYPIHARGEVLRQATGARCRKTAAGGGRRRRQWCNACRPGSGRSRWNPTAAHSWPAWGAWRGPSRRRGGMAEAWGRLQRSARIPATHHGCRPPGRGPAPLLSAQARVQVRPPAWESLLRGTGGAGGMTAHDAMLGSELGPGFELAGMKTAAWAG